MAKSGLQNESGKRLKVWEKSVKSQGILKWILSGNRTLEGIANLQLELLSSTEFWFCATEDTICRA